MTDFNNFLARYKLFFKCWKFNLDRFLKNFSNFSNYFVTSQSYLLSLMIKNQENLETNSDLAIMQLIKEGDINKLAILYERYKKPLFSYFYRLSGNRERSEDMVQTVFYRILKSNKQFKGKSKFTTWMFSIGHNVLVDAFKKRENKNLLSDMAEFDQKQNGGDVLDDMEKREQIKLLKMAIKKLDFEKREPLILSKYHGLKYKEIAGIMNLSESAVKVRVFRAIEELRQIYFEMAN